MSFELIRRDGSRSVGWRLGDQLSSALLANGQPRQHPRFVTYARAHIPYRPPATETDSTRLDIQSGSLPSLGCSSPRFNSRWGLPSDFGTTSAIDTTIIFHVHCTTTSYCPLADSDPRLQWRVFPSRFCGAGPSSFWQIRFRVACRRGSRPVPSVSRRSSHLPQFLRCGFRPL
jgi:hypothetical protein